MERRTALAYAAAAAGTVLAGSTAFAATTGVLGGHDPDPVEVEDISASQDDLATTSTTLAEPTVMTVVVDEYVTAPAPAGARVDDDGGLRAAGASDDSPDVVDDHGGDRPEGVSDDLYDDHDDDDDDDHDGDDDHAEDDDHDEDDDHAEDDD